MNKSICGSLRKLQKPDDFYGVKYFIDQGGFSSDWFKSLSDDTQLYYQRMYWNASNACFSANPFPDARLMILGHDNDVLWEKITVDDIKAIYQSYLDCWSKYPIDEPESFKNFDSLLKEVKEKSMCLNN